MTVFPEQMNMVSGHPSTAKNNGFAWISAQPLLEPLLNMHIASYMSVITYINICDGMELRHTKGHTSNP